MPLGIHLAVYVECSEPPAEGVFNANSDTIAPSHHEYFKAMRSSVAYFSAKVSSTNYYCTGTLGQAMCHSKMIMTTAGYEYDIFFLLEHDWVLPPSQMTASFREIQQSLKSGNIVYILLQRGDRNAYSRHDGLAQLRTTDVYSNNPFFSTVSFLSRITDHSDLCSRTHDPKWERLVEAYCREKRCSLAVLTTTRKERRLAIYHVDGRYLSTAFAHRLGPLFNNLNNKTMKFVHGSSSPEEFIEALDTECSALQQDCDPYFYRRAFAALLSPLAEKMASKGVTLSELITILTGEDPGQFLKGKFMRKEELTKILSNTSSATIQS